MSKISELSDGGALQSTDYLIAVRSGGNVKVQPAGMTFSSVTITSSDINGGNIDGTVIGGATPAAATFTSVTATTADINGGTIDGATLGGSSQVTITDADMNGGTIDGVTIGGSSAGAGSFTTLNTSGSVVFNDAGADVDFRVEGDTDANLLFVDASADAVGIGTSSPSTQLHVNEASTNEAALTLSNNDGTYRIGANNDFGLHFADSFKFANQADTTEYMRITSSGNVGVGVSTPSVKLEVEGDVGTGTATLFSINNSNTTYASGLGSQLELQVGSGTLIGSVSAAMVSGSFSSGSALTFANRSGGSGYTNFVVNGSERMRIDSSGRLGLGVTPSAWLSTTDVIQFGGAGGIWADASATNNTSIGSNVYYNSSSQPIYIGNDEATQYQQFGGSHIWYSASSGTAGNTISFSEAMRITSSGIVGIGTPNPNGTLTVRNDSTNTEQLILGNSTNTGGRDWRFGRDNVATGDFIIKYSDATNSNNTTEAMRIDSSGNLRFNSGYGSVATAYGCRAWVNFNGTGTVAIRESGNVSSITDNGTGNYTVNFTAAMPDANYVQFVAGQGLTGTTGAVAFNANSSGNNTTTSSEVRSASAYSDAGQDMANIYVAIVR